MKVPRLYTGPDGESHFEGIEVPLGSTGKHNALFNYSYSLAHLLNLVKVLSIVQHNPPYWTRTTLKSSI